MFKLTDGQKNAIIKAIQWYYDPHKSPIFVLGGYAGTGKSTVAKTAVEMMGLSTYQTLYVTPTGKASSVLVAKGNIANTIHSVFYRVIRFEDGRLGFSKRKSMPSTIKLIIIDEFSMVSAKMADDILSFGIPVLALGDPGQLPPVFGANPYINNPNVLLTEIMRQKGESGILTLATMARNNQPIGYGNYLESKVVHWSEVHDIEKYDVVLTWTNRTRKELNMVIRKKLGYTSKYPSKGEKIMCLKNNYIYSVDVGEDLKISPVNGMSMLNLDNAEIGKDYLKITAAPDFLLDKVFNFKASKIPFDNMFDDYEDIIQDLPEDIIVLDYAYAVTCNKSQGSEYDNVLVLDEYHGARDNYNKWLYTSITRAKKSVTIARMI